MNGITMFELVVGMTLGLWIFLGFVVVVAVGFIRSKNRLD